jgi:hypothetical protein
MPPPRCGQSGAMNSRSRVPRGLWSALALVFAVLGIVWLVLGSIVVGVVCLAAAVWFAAEASGRGVFGAYTR